MGCMLSLIVVLLLRKKGPNEKWDKWVVFETVDQSELAVYPALVGEWYGYEAAVFFNREDGKRRVIYESKHANLHDTFHAACLDIESQKRGEEG